MIEIIVLILTAVLNLLIGATVYVKNPRGATNRAFFLLTTAFVVWSTVNYISVHPVFLSQLVWIRLVLFCGALLNSALFLNFLVFPAAQLNPHYYKMVKRIVYWTIFTMALTLTPLVFKGLKTDGTAAQPVPNFGIVLFLLHTVGLIGGSIYIIIKKYHSVKGMVKNQLRLVLYGIVGTFSLILFSNFFMVVFLNNSALVPFGPAYTVIFSSCFAYAIIKHRLFDIRSTIARSVAYLMSLGFIGLLYGATAFVVTSVLNGDRRFDVWQRFFYIAFALVTAIAFQSNKRFFDKITNRLFYRDAYDPQQLLDQLNRLLVAQVDIEPLLKSVASLIVSNIKADYCVFFIRETSYFPQRFIGTKSKQFSSNDIDTLRKTTPGLHHRVVVKDNLEDNNHELRKLMDRHDIAILARLVTTVEYEVEGVGYLLLGPKKSGNLYTQQDERIIQIIANELVIAIQNGLRYEEIEEFNVTLQQKVDNATHRLQKINDKLQALDETKDEFISMASHQLRTPLTSVKGYLSMVLEGDAGEITDMQRKLLDQAFVSSQRMVYLIADLLNVSRLRTGKFVIEPVATNLADVIEGEVKQLRATAKARGLTLVYDKPKAFPVVVLDETKIRQVIMNFMDNAIYYTPAGGHIKVELKDTDKSIEFTVQDDGMGVPASERHHLFTKFYRADNAKKARPDGTGLGLFMSKKVIIAQKGTLIFRSEEGKGSTFGFSFEKSKILPAVPA
ncbi:MAG TPA: ATP-binding protein [Candidatus Limnocylindrales bacterium]|nr:ATP-binding protein [Candidatus Limnocylindrales bacterium]